MLSGVWPDKQGSDDSVPLGSGCKASRLAASGAVYCGFLLLYLGSVFDRLREKYVRGRVLFDVK